ncbi:hypothetical protein AB0L49_26945 [Streptomyces antimycoticus]|uniref:hypothetical protein n=1 Tax=Streptomyces antimycoticus TaxID=68175 RepID=UPI0034369CDA
MVQSGAGRTRAPGTRATSTSRLRPRPHPRCDRDATVLWDDDLTPAVLQDGDGASITTLLRVLRFSAECWGVTADDAWWAYGAGVATLDVPRVTAEFLARLLAVHQRRLRTP